MSTVKVIFNEGKINKNGEVPIWLRITKDRKPKYISLGVKILKSQWNDTTNKVRKSHPNSQRLNNFIAKKVSDAEGVALELEAESKYTTTKKIKHSIMGTSDESYTKFAEKSIEKLLKMGKIGSSNGEKYALAKLKKHVKEKDLLFFDITVSFLKEYEDHLRNELKNKTNTIYSDLKIMRKHFKEAFREELIPIEKNPFLRYKLKQVESERHYLTEEELSTFDKRSIDPSTMVYHYRNLYVFAAYTGGIRISDLLLLKWENFDGVGLSFRTKKTNEHLSIKVPNRALEILSLYKTPDKKPTDYIFPFFNSDVDYSIPQNLFDATLYHTTHANTSIKAIAKLCEITKNVHFHTSRHTWATLALKKGMRIEYVSKLMTHTNLRTTQIYAKIVNEELEKAMDVFN